jgi:hypothetical protein
MTAQKKGRGKLLYFLVAGFIVVGGFMAWGLITSRQLTTAHESLMADAATYQAEVELKIQTAALPSGEPADDIQKYLAVELGRTEAAFNQAEVGSDRKGDLHQRLNTLRDLQALLHQLHSFHKEFSDPRKFSRSGEDLESRKHQLNYIKDELGRALKNFQDMMKREAGG